MKIYFNNCLVSKKKCIPIQVAQGQLGYRVPKCKYSAKKEDCKEPKFYTIVLIDEDALYPCQTPCPEGYLLWMVVNAPSPNQSALGQEIVCYQSPNPPADSKPHKICLHVWEQKCEIDTENLPVINEEQRLGFPLKDFIQEYHLKCIDKGCFCTSKLGMCKKFKKDCDDDISGTLLSYCLGMFVGLFIFILVTIWMIRLYRKSSYKSNKNSYKDEVETVAIEVSA